MDYYNADMESMDVTYVRYGQVQEPISQFGPGPQTVQYRSAVPYSRSHFKTQHQFDEMDYDPAQYGDSYVPVQYDRTGSQFSSRGGSWQPGNIQQPAHPSAPSMIGSRGFTTKTFSRGGLTSGYSESSRDQTNRTKSSRSTSNYGSGMGQSSRAKSAYTTTPQSSTPSPSHGYEYNSSRTAGTKTTRSKMVPPKNEISKPKTQSSMGKAAFESTPVVLPKSILKKPSGSTMLPQKSNPVPYNNPLMSSGISTASINSGSQSGYIGSPYLNYQASQGVTEMKENGGKRLPPWKVGPGGIKKRRKPTTAEKHMKLKKYVQPKNAVMCLNELVQGTTLVYEPEPTVGPKAPICVSVKVHGKKYTGYGSSKTVAKQAAAEAALVSFVKPPTTSADGKEEDNTPWAVLASFAMFKLFNEWREGRIGVGSSPTSSIGTPLVQDATLSQSLQLLLGKSMHSSADISDQQNTSTVLSSYLERESAGVMNKDIKAHPQNPAKQLPDKAIEMNPVMLLHQMKPNLVFTQSNFTKDGTQLVKLSSNIDNITFEGEGASAKKAKFDLAMKANEALFGVKSSYTIPLKF